MKKIYIASGLVALLAATTACDQYDIYPEQYGKVMMIKDAGDRSMTIYATETAQPCYISVMKSGHSPEEPADATIKVLNESEFGDYKEKFYGSRDFKGLVALNPEFYYLGDVNLKQAPNNTLSHHFESADDRYFGVNVVFDAQKVSDWRDRLTTAAAYTGKDEVKLQEKAEALDTINNFTFVVPVGLFSTTDTINADNQYVMVMPSVENPTMKVSVNSGNYMIEDISRSKLIEDPAFKNGVLEPEVTFSIPCSNPYGFSAYLYVNKSFLDQFAEFHTDIVLNMLDNPRGEAPRYEYCDGTQMIHFPAGVTEVKMPLKIYREFMNVEELDVNYVIPFYLYPAGRVASITDPKTKVNSDMVWDNPSVVPDKVKKALKLPSNDVTWEVKKGGVTEVHDFGNYCFFVGYRVVETPLEITEDNILYYNDMETTEGSFAGLFDDDLATFFHSAWSDPVPRSTPYGSYFDIEIPSNNPINAVAFQVFARVHANPVCPKEITLYYTSRKLYDEKNPDASSWKPFNPYTAADKDPNICQPYTLIGGKDGKLGSGQLGWFGGIKKDSEWLRAPEDFDVVRFCVVKNSANEDITATGTKTTGYWNLAGMKVYGKKLN